MLLDFAARTKSPSIKIDAFIDFVEKYAERKTSEGHVWMRWSHNAKPLFYDEIPGLVESGRCILEADGRDGKIFLPLYCNELIMEAYGDNARLAHNPLPSAESLKLDMPLSYARTINLKSDMGRFFEDQIKILDLPETIILQLPLDYGSAVLLSSMIPTRLMEICLYIMQHYLNTNNNKDYAVSRMLPQVKGREKALKDLVEQISTEPLNCLAEMERSADFPFLFWTFFCPLVKNELGKKQELFEEDIAALQAVFIIEVCCSFYRARAAKKRDVDSALMVLEVLMDRAPFHFTLGEIMNFTNERGIPLLDIYSKNDLEGHIQKMIGDGSEGALSSWIVIQDVKKTEQWFLKKERYLQVCNKMIIEARMPVKDAVVKRWSKHVENFSKETSMESDIEFDRLLQKLTKDLHPVLPAVLRDPKLYLVFLELDQVPGAIPPAQRIFKAGVLIPYSSLYALRRKDMLNGVKLSYPIWYSIPILVSIFLFFRKMGAAKKIHSPEEDEAVFVIANDESTELGRSARLVESALVPPNKTLDEYLDELEGRWARILDKKARQNLITDVQTMLKDNIRYALKVYKYKRITREGLQDMSALLLKRSPSLKNRTDQDSLRLYMELYMLKLMLNKRFKP